MGASGQDPALEDYALHGLTQFIRMYEQRVYGCKDSSLNHFLVPREELSALQTMCQLDDSPEHGIKSVDNYEGIEAVSTPLPGYD